MNRSERLSGNVRPTTGAIHPARVRCACRRPASGRYRGISLIWTALVLSCMLLMVGLSIDVAVAALAAHQLHNAADAGALAGAQWVKIHSDEAIRQARSVAGANGTLGLSVSVLDNPDNDPAGEVVLGRWIRQRREFIPTTIGPSAVKVVGNRLGERDDAPAVALHFGPMAGIQTVNVSRYAIGWSKSSTGAGIIVLTDDPSGYEGWSPNQGSGFVRDGGCNIDLRGPDGIAGDIQVNAISTKTPKSAVIIGGISGKIWAGEMNVVGTTNPDPNSATWESLYGDPDLPFSVNPDSDRVNDPLDYINYPPYVPDIRAMDVRICPDVSGGVTATIEPGYYPGGLNPQGGTIVMNPGIYAVGGGTKPSQVTGLVFNGGTLIGEGVTIYVTGDPDGSKTGTNTLYGKVDLGANATVNLTSPGDADPALGTEGVHGVVLWQDKNNHREARIVGSPTSELQGTLYFPDCPLHLGGGTDQLGNQVIAGALHVHGNVIVRVAYDGRNMIKAFRSILVR